MRLGWLLLTVLGFLFATSCIHTKAGSYVEMVEQDGGLVYVAGAAGEGVGKTQACRAAVRRAAAAVSHRFAQEQDDVGEEVAESLGLSDGTPLLYHYANESVVNGSVQDLSYDPGKHYCLATVRWKPPLFLKQAVEKSAVALKAKEALNSVSRSQGNGNGSGGLEVKLRTQGKGCASLEQKLATRRAELSKQSGFFRDCLRRTDGDESICFAYRERFDASQRRTIQAEGILANCLADK